MKTLYIIRGLPGSGKSTLARSLVKEGRHFEADQYMIKDGVYLYAPSRVKDAHRECFCDTEAAMIKGNGPIAVANTFTRMWEYKPYLGLCLKHSWDWQILECHGQWPNIHDVPYDTIALMRERWEPTPNMPRMNFIVKYLSEYL